MVLNLFGHPYSWAANPKCAQSYQMAPKKHRCTSILGGPGATYFLFFILLTGGVAVCTPHNHTKVRNAPIPAQPLAKEAERERLRHASRLSSVTQKPSLASNGFLPLLGVVAASSVLIMPQPSALAIPTLTHRRKQCGRQAPGPSITTVAKAMASFRRRPKPRCRKFAMNSTMPSYE